MSQETEKPADTAHIERVIEDATQAIAVQTSALEQLEAGAPSGDPVGLDGLRDIPVPVTIEIGRTRLPLQELLALAPGSLVALDRGAHEPVDVYVGGKLYARGEVVTVGENYGVRITSLS